MRPERITSRTSSQTSSPSGSPASTRLITWATSSGCARDAAAPRTLSARTRARTLRCSNRYGSSWRKEARGPDAAARRPKRGRAPTEDVLAEELIETSSSSVLLVNRLPGHPEGERDDLPREPGVAGPAHRDRLDRVEFRPQLRDSPQCGIRIVGVRVPHEGSNGIDAHGCQP